MTELSFDIVKKEIPPQTEFSSAILNSENPEELLDLVCQTQIVQNSGLEIDDVMNILYSLATLSPYTPRRIGHALGINNVTGELSDPTTDLLFYIGHAEAMTDISFFVLEEEGPKESLIQNFINKLANETEVLLEDPIINGNWGISPAIQNKLKLIFNFSVTED